MLATIRRWFGYSGKPCGGLRWKRIEDAKQTEFFRWFSLAEVGSAKDGAGKTVISFRPEGDKFRRLVKLDAVLDQQGDISALHLSLAMSFVNDQRDGLFARDIAKSFLRSALPEHDDGSLQDLANEIEYRHNFPVLTRAPSSHPRLPLQPTVGFLAFVGLERSYEETSSQCCVRIEQTWAGGGEAVMITVRANQ